MLLRMTGNEPGLDIEKPIKRGAFIKTLSTVSLVFWFFNLFVAIQRISSLVSSSQIK